MLVLLQHYLTPLECLLAYFLACLLDNLTIILLDDCEEFETFTYTIFKTILFSCIRTDLLYRYYFSCIIIYDSDIHFVLLDT